MHGNDPRTSVPSPPETGAAPRRSLFPPIADYAFLSDCNTTALIVPDGAGQERIEGQRRPPGDYTGRGTLVRMATSISGQVDLMLDCMPLFDYGRHSGTWSYQGPGYGPG